MRTVLHFHPALAPFKAAVLPLQKNKLGDAGQRGSTSSCPSSFMVDYDETGSIGKRYRRQDEIGTPFCITRGLRHRRRPARVTVRDRDTMEQERVKVDDLEAYIAQRVKF